MIILNIPLTILSIAMAFVMVKVTNDLASKSGAHFAAQQRDLGAVDGFIEEMLDGQKVVKVFCHEDKAIEDFVKINDKLRVSANEANKYANIMMPINANIGNLSYVLCAIVGAILAINGYAGLTLGTIVTFSCSQQCRQPDDDASKPICLYALCTLQAHRSGYILH